MIVIDGPLWFLGALLICGAHVLYLRSWRHEQQLRQAWGQKYAADAQQRHEEFMRAMGRDEAEGLGWERSNNGERGQT